MIDNECPDYAIGILVISVIFSIIVCAITIVGVRFMKVSAINKIEYLNSLMTRAENRLQLQNWTDESLKKLAEKVGANLEVMREERSIFRRLIRGEPPKPESTIGRLISNKQSDFKTPENLYDEASFSDPQFQTQYHHAALNNDDVFLHKKDVLVSMKGKEKHNK